MSNAKQPASTEKPKRDLRDLYMSTTLLELYRQWVAGGRKVRK